MKQEKDKYRLLFEKMPDAFAYHKVIYDQQGAPADYIFLEVNDAFEEMTGLKRKEVIGKKVTEVHPEIGDSAFDWIGVYGNVSLEGEGIRFEQYFEPADRWYDVSAFSDAPGFFAVSFREVTTQKNENKAFAMLVDRAQEIMHFSAGELNYQAIADSLLELSEAKFAAVNLYDQDHQKSVTKALSGISNIVRKVSDLLGFELVGKQWDIMPERVNAIQEGRLLHYKNLYESAAGAVSPKISFMLERLAGTGSVYVAEIKHEDDTLGDMIMFMPRHKTLVNPQIIEIYAALVASALVRFRSDEELINLKTFNESIVQNINEGIIISDNDGNVTFANAALLKMLGYDAEQLIGMHWSSLVPPQDYYRIEEAYKRRSEGKADRYEISLKHKNDSLIPVQISGSPYRDSKTGNIIGTLAVQTNLSDRKMAEEALRESEQRYRDILDSIEDGFYEVSLQGKIVFCNRAAAKLLGYKEEELVGKSYKTICKDIDAVFREFNQAYKAGEPKFSVIMEMIRKDGSIVSADISVSLTYDREGNISGFCGLGRDVTERREAEQVMKARLDLMEYSAGNSLDAVLQRTLDQVCTITNSPIGFYHFVSADEKQLTLKAWSTDTLDSFCEMGERSGMQYSVDDAGVWVDCMRQRRPVIHNDYNSLPHRKGLPKGHARVIRELVVPIMRQGKIVAILGVGNKEQDYTEKDVEIVTYFADIAWEIAERKKAEENIYSLSMHDQLTGLYNRRYFENELERLNCSREHPLAIISADLDGLKLINDTLGHAEGDIYLQNGARLLKSVLRASDILARVGGDEFALIMPHTDRNAAESLVARIRMQIDEYNRNQSGMPLSISIGLAVSESKKQPLEETYKIADSAMYKDKLQRGQLARAGIVSALIDQLNERGDLGEGDSAEVQLLSDRLGRVLKLQDSELDDLGLLTRVYDLGKVNMPDQLIHSSLKQKSGDLTETDREVIRRHPEIGYRIAGSSPELIGVADLILRHHENFDGSGYPLGIEGEEIPVECRILAITIAYSAMTHPRPYANQLKPDEALAELKRCAGSQFDPHLVPLFVKIMKQK